MRRRCDEKGVFIDNLSTTCPSPRKPQLPDPAQLNPIPRIHRHSVLTGQLVFGEVQNLRAQRFGGGWVTAT